jgi:hypothetical protein
LSYYPWYGNSAGAYRHWQQGGHTPPDDLGANFSPVLGPYDSGAASVVEQHMRWIEQSGAGVIVYSWWGQRSYEDGLADGVLDAAARHGIKVAWHLEPYAGRTASSTVADIGYLQDRYDASPAFYREGGRGAFYVFESLRITDLRRRLRHVGDRVGNRLPGPDALLDGPARLRFLNPREERRRVGEDPVHHPARGAQGGRVAAEA